MIWVNLDFLVLQKVGQPGFSGHLTRIVSVYLNFQIKVNQKLPRVNCEF